MKKRVLFAIIGFLCLFVSMQAFSDDTKKIKPSELPKAVTEAVYKAVPNIHIFKAKSNFKKKETVYEVKGFINEDIHELEIGSEGEILTRKIVKPDKNQISLSEVPDNIKAIALNILEGIQLYKAKLKIKKTIRIYELEGIIDDKIYELEIRDDGTILEIELDD